MDIRPTTSHMKSAGRSVRGFDPPGRRGGATVGGSLLVVLAAAVAVLQTAGGTSHGGPPQPEVFFVVRDARTQIVEVETATGKVRRSFVDFGPADGTEQPPDVDSEIAIETLDLAGDRSALFFGRFSLPERHAVYRLDLPDGRPVRVAAGRGPSVSPDGRRLAYTLDAAVRVRDLTTGEEQVFENIFGELGGITTAWSADSRSVAFEVEAADAVHPGLLDTMSGEVTELEPQEGPSPGGYNAYSPVFRSSDGLVAVGCCMSPDMSPDIPQEPSRLALHDPTTGRETKRVVLRFTIGPLDFDRSGAHLLIVGPDGRVQRRTGDRFREVPHVTDVDLAVW
jgi:hypothetical protein